MTQMLYCSVYKHKFFQTSWIFFNSAHFKCSSLSGLLKSLSKKFYFSLFWNTRGLVASSAIDLYSQNCCWYIFVTKNVKEAFFIFNVCFSHLAPRLDWASSRSERPGLQGQPTCSMGMCLTRPLTTVLGVASPTSTCSTYRESASGCFSAVRMRPTRRSRRDTSTLSSSWGATGFFSPAGTRSAKQSSVTHQKLNTLRNHKKIEILWIEFDLIFENQKFTVIIISMLIIIWLGVAQSMRLYGVRTEWTKLQR